MDAASNNKVENVREIRDKVQYPPVAGKYKVYIIDEVHMLTPEAFNALLKTLEEPPAHAVFILATTEQHKLPATILSRCMRFDFKLVPDKLIVSLIERIYKEVGKEYEKEAVVKIARSGEGCVRDALSVADLCLSFSDKKLTYNDVIDVLGASDNQKTYELLEGMFSSSSAKALSVTEELCASGKSVGLMCKDVQSVLRDVLIVKTCKDYAEVLAMPENELSAIKSLADMVDEHRMLRILEIFSSVENDLKYSTHPRVVFETAVLKATMPAEDYNIDALIGRITKLEKQLEELQANGIKVPVSVDYQPITEQKPVEKPVEKTVEIKPQAEDKKEENPANDETAATVVKADIGEEIDKFFEDGLPEPPPEEYEPAPVIEKPAERPQPSVTAEQTEKPRELEPVNEMRVWGKVVRKLRADKNIMLWIACQDAEPKAIGDKFVVYVDGDNEYNLLTKPENTAILQEAVATECGLKVAISKKGAVVDGFEQDIEKVKDVLGDVEVVD